jgi:hypothetical protein
LILTSGLGHLADYGFWCASDNCILLENVMDGKLLGRFRSPTYLVVSRLLEGRANWKNKCKEARKEIKRYKNRVNDIGKSRESWRQRAETSERELKVLRGELEELKEELRLREEEPNQKATAV